MTFHLLCCVGSVCAARPGRTKYLSQDNLVKLSGLSYQGNLVRLQFCTCSWHVCTRRSFLGSATVSILTEPYDGFRGAVTMCGKILFPFSVHTFLLSLGAQGQLCTFESEFVWCCSRNIRNIRSPQSTVCNLVSSDVVRIMSCCSSYCSNNFMQLCVQNGHRFWSSVFPVAQVWVYVTISLHIIYVYITYY